MVWIEGEPGIGKSSLVAEALAVAGQPRWDVGWAGADQLMMLPLRVMQDCLQVRPSSPDPRRAQAADLLRSRSFGPLSGGDATVNGAEVLLTLADELCAAAPTVLVVDDLQWADDASLAVWHQLASSISQLRLLLIGTCRPTPRRKEVEQVRAGVVRRGGEVVTRSSSLHATQRPFDAASFTYPTTAAAWHTIPVWGEISSETGIPKASLYRYLSRMMP